MQRLLHILGQVGGAETIALVNDLESDLGAICYFGWSLDKGDSKFLSQVLAVLVGCRADRESVLELLIHDVACCGQVSRQTFDADDRQSRLPPLFQVHVQFLGGVSSTLMLHRSRADSIKEESTICLGEFPRCVMSLLDSELRDLALELREQLLSLKVDHPGQQLVHNEVRVRVGARETRVHVAFGRLHSQVEAQNTAQSCRHEDC
mmetsp:Transcript_31489/g.41692  ORF Transcript_31489/g.41692 Transcript_31489/m.41692 type:complete len:206 (-) Transcript_31489:632-1249(-)